MLQSFPKYPFFLIPFLLSKVLATPEDYYFGLCSGIIATNAAYKCADTEGYKQNITCQCTDADFARSLYLCIDDSSKVANAPEGVPASWKAYGRLCKSKNLDAPLMHNVQWSLRLAPMDQTYAEANSTKTGGFQVPTDMLVESNIPRAGLKIHRQGYICTHWGGGLIGYIMGIMAIQIALNISSWFFPRFTRVVQNSKLGKLIRRFITMPALFNSRQAEPRVIIGFWPLMFPLRVHAFLIAGLYICVIVFLTADFGVETSPYGTSSKSAYTALWLSYRSGWFSMYLLVPTFLFAGRNNFLIWMTGWQHSTFLVWHKHLARLSTLLGIIHASARTVLMKELGIYSEDWHRNYFILGFLAIMTMSLACLQGVKVLRSCGYDIFVHIHFALAVISCAGLWRHVERVNACYEMLYAMIALWGFDRLYRITRMIINSPNSVCVVRDYGDIMMLKIEHSNIWKPTAGSYVFIHFLHPVLFMQSHPFTALYVSANENVVEDTDRSEKGSITRYSAEECEDSGYIKLLIQKRHGITKHISRRQNWHVLIDGPYGVQFNMAPYHEMVFIAGGIGITGAFSHLKHAITYNSSNLKSISLYWSVRDLSALMWFHQELVEMTNNPIVNVLLHVSTNTEEPYHRYFFRNYLYKNKNIFPDDHENYRSLSHWEKNDKLGNIIRYSRIQINDLVLDHISNCRGPVCFFSCGPGRMCDDVRRSVSMHLSQSKNYVQYFEESFAF